MDDNREKELVNAITFLSTMLGAYAYLLMNVSQKLEEIGQSYGAWQQTVERLQQAYNLDIEKVMKLIEQPPYSPDRKEYLN